MIQIYPYLIQQPGLHQGIKMKTNFEKGGALFVTIVIIMSMVIASAVAMVSWSRKGYKYAVRKTENSRSFYVADSAIKYALNRIIFDSSKSILNLGQISNDFITIANSFIPGNEFQITKFTIVEAMTNGIFSKNIEDIFLLEKMYDIRCQVTNLANNGLGGDYSEISCLLGDLSVSIFQFAMYYQDIELELSPGSTETRIGRVHSNKSMHLTPYGTLKFLDKVTCAEKIYHSGLEGDAYRRLGRNGSIYFKDEDGNYVNMKTNTYDDSSFLDSSDPQWKLKATERWGDTVKTREHGVGTIQLPFTDSLDNTRVLIDHDPMTNEPYEITKQRFENKAALVIAPDGDIYEQTGVLTNAEFTSRTYIDNITNVNWAIATNQFFNKRNMDYWTNDTENGMVYPIDINVGLFNGWVSNQPSSMSFKNPSSERAGILYVEQTNETGHAVRLSNTEELYSLPYGFTLATPNPLYVKGDYNTKIGGSYTTNHPSALLSDAMTILSDYWEDEDNQIWPANVINPNIDPKPFSYCNYACNTKINTAVMTGSAETTGDYRASGCANNLIRYLEYWKYRTFEISGNQTCLWKSKHEFQPYIYQNKYDETLDPWHYYWPSYRRFLYDSNLKSRKPPGFDDFYTYRVLAWKKIH